MRNVQSLYPYHSHVSPVECVNGINNLIDRVENGEQVFLKFYPNNDKRVNKTGLFFFKGKKDAPFAVICPGGAFQYIATAHEGFPICMELNRLGFNAFSIHYRLGFESVAVEDLANALHFIINHAKELGVAPTGYSVWGGSAGARMAARIGSYYQELNLPKPGMAVVAYTGHSDYTKNDPPTYVIVGDNDWIASSATMKRRCDNLNKLGIDTEFHLIRGIGHGFGLGKGTPADGWVEQACNFWRRHI